jgi:putative hydrolase of the HAD superfamily
VSKYKNIIFDLGGVLLPVDYHAVIRAFEQLGMPDADQFYSQQTQQPLFDRFERGEISGGEFLRTLKTFFPQADERELTHAWNAILGRFPEERLNLLTRAAKHYRLFLLSNTNEIHISRFLQDLKADFGLDNLNTHFEEVYFSYETGFRKPEREIYELVLLENNLIAEETLFIEDTEKNVTGALQVGIPTRYLHVHEGEKVEDLFCSEGLLTSDSSVRMPL